MSPYRRLLAVTFTATACLAIALGPLPSAGASPAPASARGAATQPAADPRERDVLSAAADRARAAMRKPSGNLRSTTGTAAVALTFDDGPDPVWTPRILGLLRKHKIKATFCLVGVQVRRYPRLARQIAREGHTLCNHTMGHDQQLRHKPGVRIAADLAQTNRLIKSATGVTPRYFRAPGGNWSTGIRRAAASQHMQSLHWTVDPQDWRRPPAYRIVGSVKKLTRPGSVILLHDAGGNRAQTEIATRTLLPYLAKRYRLAAL
jgi:peptidoglycan/xylan/chitin deacetylase (PgdA/CDA1 family)